MRDIKTEHHTDTRLAQNAEDPKAPFRAVSFDTTTPMGAMKKLQDPAKFEKARFRFRLYKK